MQILKPIRFLVALFVFASLGSVSSFAQTVTVNPDVVGKTPAVIGINSGNSEPRRSSVDALVIGFDSEVVLQPGAVSVVQRSTATAATFEPVTVNVTQQLVNDETVITIGFNSHTRNGAGALVDGNYQLTINASLVTNGGTPMAEDFVFGDVEADGFFSYYGDSSGDRTVNVVDLLTFRNTFLGSTGNPAYDFFMDFDANGTVNVVDLLQFRERFLTTLPFTFGSSISGFRIEGSITTGPTLNSQPTLRARR